jgi:hypothetical protein
MGWFSHFFHDITDVVGGVVDAVTGGDTSGQKQADAIKQAGDQQAAAQAAAAAQAKQAADAAAAAAQQQIAAQQRAAAQAQQNAINQATIAAQQAAQAMADSQRQAANNQVTVDASSNVTQADDADPRRKFRQGGAPASPTSGGGGISIS